MSLAVVCNSCSASLKAPEGAAGLTFCCPECGNEVVVKPERLRAMPRAERESERRSGNGGLGLTAWLIGGGVIVVLCLLIVVVVLSVGSGGRVFRIGDEQLKRLQDEEKKVEGQIEEMKEKIKANQKEDGGDDREVHKLWVKLDRALRKSLDRMEKDLAEIRADMTGPRAATGSFASVRNGMSFGEVAEAMGTNGKKIYQHESERIATAIYQWRTATTSIEVTFTDWKVASKSESAR